MFTEYRIGERNCWYLRKNKCYSVDQILKLRKQHGLRLREIRELRGLSQSQLSKLTGIPKTSISKIETGEWSVSIDLILRLAKHLDFEINFNTKEV